MKKNKPKKVTFADYTGQFTNKPFAEGGIGPTHYDCMGLVYAFFVGQNKNIPCEFGEYTTINYSDLFKKDKIMAIKQMFRFFDSFAEKIEVYEKLAGDLVMVRMVSEDRLFPAIYVGNGNIMATYYDCGVKVMSCKEPVKIVRAWRIK